MKLLLIRKIQLLIPFLLILMAHSSLSHAASEIYCSTYTKNAVAQNEQNLENNCNYTGPRWNSDPTHHTKWCLNASNIAAQNEHIARIGQLAKCKEILFPAGADKWCNIYSRVSIGQNIANLSTKCGFSGPAWSANYINHYSWCTNASEKRVKAQITGRQRQLENCGR